MCAMQHLNCVSFNSINFNNTNWEATGKLLALVVAFIDLVGCMICSLCRSRILFIYTYISYF